MEHKIEEYDIVSWKAGRQTRYGRIIDIKGKTAVINMRSSVRPGAECTVALDRLTYEPPVRLTAETLGKFARFEIRFSELMQGRPYADMDIIEKYQIVPEDLKAAVLNYQMYGISEDDFGEEYFWTIWDDLYDGIEIETALNGPEGKEENKGPFPNQYTVFSNAWEVFLQKYEYETENIDLNDVITEVQIWEDNKDKPLSKREFSHTQKWNFIRYWNNDRLVSADEEIKAVYRKILDSLCEADETEALNKKAYACYGHGNAAYGQNWQESLKCLLRLMELDPTPQIANTLGYMYYYGRCTDGVPEYDKAFYYFSIGAAGWYYESRYKLADMFWHGYGVQKNPQAAASLIWEVYGELVKKFRNGHFKCSFADAALRAGNIYKEGINCLADPDNALYYYLQAQYAIRMRMLATDQYGDQKVAAGIEQAITEILPKTRYAKRVGTVHFTGMYFLLQNGLRRKHQMEMKISKVSDTEVKLAFRIIPYENEKYAPKLLVTVPPAHFCGLLEKVTVTARKIRKCVFYEESDTIRISSVSGSGFYLYGRKVAEIDADFVFTVPRDSGKKRSFVSVTFNPGGKRYDYLSDIPLQPGDRAVVNTSNGEAVVTVAAVFEKTGSELALPLKKYKKIIRKSD